MDLRVTLYVFFLSTTEILGGDGEWSYLAGRPIDSGVMVMGYGPPMVET